MLSDDEIRRRLQEDPRSIVDRGGECFVDFPGGPSFDDLEWSWERDYPVKELFERVMFFPGLRGGPRRAFRTLREASSWYESERSGANDPSYYEELELSVAREGVRDELSVADLGDGRLDLLDGWHRLALAIKHGLDTVPVFLGKLRAKKNPPDPLPPPHGGTTTRVEKAAIYRHKACEAKLGRKVVWRPTFVVDVERWKIPGKWGPQTRVRERWWATDPASGRTYTAEGPPQTPCPECGRLVSGSAIAGVRNDAIPCTAKCVAAIGPSCECSCAGANHGASWGGARSNPGSTWFTGRKDDLGLRVHPWTFFDGQVGDSPIWITPEENFARQNAGYHGFVYAVRFEPKKLFPEAPLLQFVGNYLEATPVGTEVLEALGRGEIFPDLPPEDAFDALKAIDRGDYDVMETKAMVDWLLRRGHDAMVVTGDGPVNIAVFDPSAIEVLSIQPATPGHDQRSCRACSTRGMA